MNQVEICNLALLRLGHDRTIADLDEMSAEAGYLRAFWDSSRRTALRAHAWNFAVKTDTLALLGDTSDEYDFVYSLPVKCLRPVEIVNTYSKAPEDRVPFEVRGRKVLTDEEGAVLKYVEDLTDENLFDSEFIDALAYLLASELAGPLTQDRARRADMYQLYKLRVGDAKATDLSEGESTPSMTYIQARA